MPLSNLEFEEDIEIKSARIQNLEEEAINQKKKSTNSTGVTSLKVIGGITVGILALGVLVIAVPTLIATKGKGAETLVEAGEKFKEQDTQRHIESIQQLKEKIH